MSAPAASLAPPWVSTMRYGENHESSVSPLPAARTRAGRKVGCPGDAQGGGPCELEDATTSRAVIDPGPRHSPSLHLIQRYGASLMYPHQRRSAPVYGRG